MQLISDEHEARQYFLAILKNVVEAVIVITPDGRVELFNPAAERIFGYQAPEVIGRNVHILAPSPHQQHHDSYIHNFLRTGNAHVIGIGREETGRRKNGDTFPMYLSVAEVKTPTRHRFVGVIRDISHIKQAEIALQNAKQATDRVNAELQAKQKALDEDLRAAAVIQQTLLPQDLLNLLEIDMAWKFIPSSVVGGDIFNVLVLDESHLGMYMLDVSGHGVQSAMVTVAVSQMLNPLSYGVIRDRLPDPPYYRLVNPGEVLQRLDHQFPLERFGKFFTMVYAVLNKSTGRLFYSSAGHPPPIVLRADGTLERLECGGSVVGLGGLIPFEEDVVQLQAGDTVLLYTDGVTEHVNAAGEPYDTIRLMNCLKRWTGSDAHTLVEALAADVAAFAPEVNFKDDVSLLALQYTIQPGGGV